MKVKTAYSQKTEVKEIVADIKNQIGEFDIKFIQFFCSSNIQPDKISIEMQNVFENVLMIGCTSAGEIISGKMLDNSLVVMAFSSKVFNDLKIEILTNISTDKNVVDKAFDNFASYYQTPMANLDPHKYVGLLLIDGMCGKEEKINERIGDLTNVTFIGGSAGDDLRFEKTYIFVNGKTYENAAVLVLCQCNTEFDILKTQSFKTTPNKIKITKSDESSRAVIEINHKPAVEEYARLIGKNKENILDAFFTYPLGLGYEDNIFVRSPQRIDGDKIIFYGSVKEGMELTILESTDIVIETQKRLNEKINSLGSISAIINYHCILRTLELKARNMTDEYGEIFKDIPTIGFSTYGESYIGHINQTSTMLLFK